jgi:hypothetical protein
MTSKIDCSKALQEDMGNQLTQLKGCKWKVSPENLGYYSVQIEKNKSILEGYHRSVSRTPSELHEGFGKSLEKIEKKIKSLEEVVEHLASNSGETDPRIKKLSSKVHGLNSDSPEIDKKIAKYTARLLGLKHKDCNELLNVLHKHTIGRLKDGHLVARCDLRTLNLFDYFRSLVKIDITPNSSNANTQIIDLFTYWVQTAREHTSTNFLESMLEGGAPRGIHHPDFIKNLVEDGHKQVRKNLESSSPRPTLGKSENFFNLSIGHEPLTNPTVDQLTCSLDAILRTKQQMTLANIAAVIHFQDKHLALAIGPDNIIYLLNPHEDPTELHIVAFTDIKSASELIHLIINKQIPDEIYSNFLPYTSKDTPIEILGLFGLKTAQLCGVKNEQDINTQFCQLLSQNTQLLGENADLFGINNILLGNALHKISDTASKINQMLSDTFISSHAKEYYKEVELYGTASKRNHEMAMSLHEESVPSNESTALPPIEILREILRKNAKLLSTSNQILESNDDVLAILLNKVEFLNRYSDLLSEKNSAWSKTLSELKKELNESIEPLRKNSQLLHKNVELLRKNSEQLSGNIGLLSLEISPVTIDVICSAKEHARAEQRAQVITLLHDLNSSLSNGEDVAPILRSIEDIKLDPVDLPKGLAADTKDLACALFGKLYHIYLAAWENNRTMVHPHDGRFHSDFGRNAFVGEARNSVPTEYKILALQDLMKSIQDAWKL